MRRKQRAGCDEGGDVVGEAGQRAAGRRVGLAETRTVEVDPPNVELIDEVGTEAEMGRS